jgi:6-phosphogluconolactonase (cycloisomerase 2 family)
MAPELKHPGGSVNHAQLPNAPRIPSMAWMRLAAAAGLALLSACGGSNSSSPPPATYTIGGTLSGLGAGLSLVLQDNAADPLTVTANGAITFAKSLASGTAYAVTVATQPTGQTCTVTGGAGTAMANVTNVAVACTSNASSGGYTSPAGAVTIAANHGTLGTVSTVATPAAAPGGLATPFGWISFSVKNLAAGASVTLSFTLPAGYTLTGAEKCGTSCAAIAGVSISGSTLSYTVTDGGAGDTDGAANGTIADPVAILGSSSNTAATGKFLYSANNGDGTISAFTINASSGALTAMGGSPVAAGMQPYELKRDPSGHFLYAVDESTPGAVLGYAIDATTGALAAVPGSPFAVGNVPESLAFDASGSYLYAANSMSNTISAFIINSTSGALSAVSGSPFTVAGTNPGPQALAAAGGFLYVVNGTTNTVAVLAINASTGALSASSSASTGTSPYAIAIDPSGAVAYVANAGTGAGSLSAYTINAATGALAAVSTGAGIAPGNYLGIDPGGKFLFVTVATGVSVYPITTATAALAAAVTGSPFATGTNAYSVAIDPSGKFVYVANDGSANISGFTLNATTGVLTPISGGAVAAGTFPDFLAID